MPSTTLRRTIGLKIGVLWMMAAWPIPAAANENPTQVPAPLPASLAPRLLHANFLDKTPSPAARQVADWAMASGDIGDRPFVVIDKLRATVFVFDATGLLRGTSMALLGFALGDYSTPGIGTRKLAAIRPAERTTPAGRFVATLGHDLHGDILWVDYDAAISLHRVITGNPGDHRRERLASPSLRDKRISYGCINVPAQFFDDVVLKLFNGTSGIVYILPEQRKLEEFFPLAAAGPR